MIHKISEIISMVPEFTEKVYATGPSKEILTSADIFFMQIPPFYRKILSIDNLTINDGGTISMDWMVRKDFVSVEVGANRVGFFSEMPDGSNPEGVFTLGTECPKAISNALDMLYGRNISQ